MSKQIRLWRSCWRSLAGALVFALFALAVRAAVAENGMPPCLECVTLRLEHPIVLRGPSPYEPDAPASVIRLPDGSFRGFSPGGETLAIDGADPIAALQNHDPGQVRTVLAPGPADSGSDCGRWITSILNGLGSLYGLIHNETRCGDTHGSYKIMSIAKTTDFGLTWNVLGPIIATDQPNAPHSEGEGDCTGIDGHNGYWYAYCLRRRDYKNTVARAPIENPGPGKWFKWSGAGWNAPGIGGTGAGLNGFVGMSAAYWSGPDVVMVLGSMSAALQLSISEDKVHFGAVPDPIILYDEYNWQRPAPSELYAYPSMIADRGFSDIREHFFLTYMYVPPNEDFKERYLVAQEGWIGAAARPQSPQVRTALSRFVDADGHTWATTGPTLSRGRSYSYDKALGYLMTAAPARGAAVKLDECFSDHNGVGFLANAGHCGDAGSARRRPAGYAFRDEAPGTVPLLVCVTAMGTPFMSNRGDCENKGSRAVPLGFALQ